MLKIFTSFLLACLALSVTSPLQHTVVQKLPPATEQAPADTSVLTVPEINETKLKYSRVPLNEDFDFVLEAVDRGKFTLNIPQDTQAPLVIKVYDIIGNLLYQETIRVRGSFEKEFDLSLYENQLFIVEVGDGVL